MIAGVVLSHWVLDLLVHRPDLLLWLGGPKVGLGVWNLPLSEMALEMGLVALAAVAWTGHAQERRRAGSDRGLFVLLLTAAQMLGGLPMKTDPGPLAMGSTVVIIHLLVASLSLFFDRPRPRASPLRR